MVRRALGARRVGHAGTLDPFATGLLLVLVGRATRLARYLVGLRKRYVGVLRLGEERDTLDRTGVVVATSDRWRDLDDDGIRHAMAGMVGTSLQTPPRYSAKKIGGQPAHRRVRRGEDVTMAARPVEVSAFTMEGRDGADVRFDVTVSSGTYVRALAADLGRQLGCGAHLTALRRIEVGPFEVGEAVPPQEVDRMAVRPPADAVSHLQAVALEGDQGTAVRQGRAIPAAGPGAGPVALLEGGALVAVAEADAGWLRPRVVVAP